MGTRSNICNKYRIMWSKKNGKIGTDLEQNRSTCLIGDVKPCTVMANHLFMHIFWCCVGRGGHQPSYHKHIYHLISVLGTNQKGDHHTHTHSQTYKGVMGLLNGLFYSFYKSGFCLPKKNNIQHHRYYFYSKKKKK